MKSLILEQSTKLKELRMQILGILHVSVHSHKSFSLVCSLSVDFPANQSD
jgi:hypothetical protein